MNPRELTTSLLAFIAVAGFILATIALDWLSNHNLIAFVVTGGVIAILLWLIYILLVVRDHQRKIRAQNNPTLWMMLDGQWTAMDGSGRRRPANQKPENQPLFDQDGEAL